MADTRQWPGFRSAPIEPWGGTGATATGSPRSAVGDPTYPQVVANDAKSGRAGDLEELSRSVDRNLTKQQAINRRALAEGLTTNAAMQSLAQAIRFMPGGRETFLGYVLRAHRNGDPDAGKFWFVYSDLKPTTQKRIDLDAVCEASGVTPDTLMAVVVSTAMRFGADVADMMAAVHLPAIVRQTHKSALRIGGKQAKIALRDREMVLEHHKWIPTKGATVNVNASANASSAAAAAAAHPSVPSFMESLNPAVAAREQVQREQAHELGPVNGELVE